MASKNWLAEIWFGDTYTECAEVYGATLAELRSAAAEWLLKKSPETFTNGKPETTDLSKRYSYAFSEERGRFISEGWAYVQGSDRFSSSLKNFEAAVEHFVSTAIIPRKGPDYVEMSLTVDGSLALHLVRSVKETDKIIDVNDLIQRGWRIIALGFSGDAQYHGEAVSRTTNFVLGHPEEGAF